MRDADQVRREVRETYGRIAEGGSRGCGPGASAASCCEPVASASCCETEAASSSCCGEPGASSGRLGYSDAQLESAPKDSDLGLGCGNPQAIAALREGEVVLDLGSGGGFDCFLAGQQVGPTGRVIGVDMTPAMLEKARANARQAGASNVEFRLGEIEHLPVSDASVDVVISNCVVNLSPDKASVYREAFRALRPGGRLAIADIVTSAPLPEQARSDLGEWASCMAGADSIDELRATLESAGFVRIRIQPLGTRRDLPREWRPGAKATDYVVSASIEATKARESDTFPPDRPQHDDPDRAQVPRVGAGR